MTACARAIGFPGALLVFAALTVPWSSSARYGLGIDSDGVWKISAAENLLEGRGLVTCRAEVFSLWPSRYPLVIAGLRALDIEVLAGLRVLRLHSRHER